MNTRIREFEKQCWDDQTNHLDTEKFTELIVRECGVALYPMLYKMVSRGQAYDLIKQHFGKEKNK